jgi:hypothetical protein
MTRINRKKLVAYVINETYGNTSNKKCIAYVLGGVNEF